MVLEFTMDDIISFPNNSGIPKDKWPDLKISSFFMLKRFIEFQMKYNTRIILAGDHGQNTARSIFKRVIEYGQQQAPKRKRQTRRKY
jgi:hypothetical protein